MKWFIIYLYISVCFYHANMKKINYLLHGAKNMGDNIGKVVYRTLPFNAVAPPGPETSQYIEGAVYCNILV